MASSFIKYKDKGIWLKDSWSELLAMLLSTNADKVNNKPEWLHELNNHWKDISKGYFTGYINFRFDEYILDEQRLNIINQVIDQTLNSLTSTNNVLKKSDINKLLNNSRVWAVDIEVFRIQNLLNIIKDLINQKRGYFPEEPITYDDWSF